VQRGDNWATSSRVTNRMTGTTTRATQGSGGGEAVTRRGPQGNSGVARTANGDVYAGRDGNVYKKQDGGGWSQWDNGNGGWNSAQPTEQQRQQAQQRANDARSNADSSTVGQLNRDSAARSEGAQRTNNYSSSQRSGSSSYGGGGRSRGGGGGRRR
jgi:hypothetical protein